MVFVAERDGLRASILGPSHVGRARDSSEHGTQAGDDQKTAEDADSCNRVGAG